MHTTNRNAIEGRSWHDRVTPSFPIFYASYCRKILRLYPENPDIRHVNCRAETMESGMKVLNANSTEMRVGWGVQLTFSVSYIIMPRVSVLYPLHIFEIFVLRCVPMLNWIPVLERGREGRSERAREREERGCPATTFLASRRKFRNYAWRAEIHVQSCHTRKIRDSFAFDQIWGMNTDESEMKWNTVSLERNNVMAIWSIANSTFLVIGPLRHLGFNSTLRDPQEGHEIPLTLSVGHRI